MKRRYLFWLLTPVLVLIYFAYSLGARKQVNDDEAVAQTIAARVLNESAGETPVIEITDPAIEPPGTPQPTATPTPSATPKPRAGGTQVSPIDNMVMIYIPSVSFRMGTDDGSDSKNKPSREVMLDSYWMDQTEVSNAQYEMCVQAGKCTAPSFNRFVTRLDYFGNSDFADFPVVYVTWHQADTYCKWAGRELPTEAQWENAARGPEGYIYPWGNEM